MIIEQVDLQNPPIDFYNDRIIFKLRPGGDGSYGPTSVMSVCKDVTVLELKVALAHKNIHDPDIKELIEDNQIEEKLLLAYVDLEQDKRFALDDYSKVSEMINYGETIEMSIRAN